MAVLQESDTEKALETIGLDPAQTPISPLNVLERETFSRLALSRAQFLRDHGLTVTLKPATPLIQVPAELKNSTLALPAPAAGEWEMSGNLAFLDSVRGFMTRTGNMRLNAIDITVDATQPQFAATGTYYVQ